MELVLEELKNIRESIHDLRDELNGKWAAVASHGQWIESHEKADEVVHGVVKENQRKLEDLIDKYNETRGAVRMLKLVIAGVAGILALLQAIVSGVRR